eukprot:1156636-Amphidinium_carterae.1
MVFALLEENNLLSPDITSHHAQLPQVGEDECMLDAGGGQHMPLQNGDAAPGSISARHLRDMVSAPSLPTSADMPVSAASIAELENLKSLSCAGLDEGQLNRRI